MRLSLDGTVVRVRLDRKATSISLLVVIGVREDGQKCCWRSKTWVERPPDQHPDRAAVGRTPEITSRRIPTHQATTPMAWASASLRESAACMLVGRQAVKSAVIWSVMRRRRDRFHTLLRIFNIRSNRLPASETLSKIVPSSSSFETASAARSCSPFPLNRCSICRNRSARNTARAL